MAKSNVKVEAAGLLRRFEKLDSVMQSGVRAVVREYTFLTYGFIRKSASKPVAEIKVGNRRVTQRSKPGQSPRTATGRMLNSIAVKMSPKGYVGTVSTGPLAADSRGRRYPWMLESGTKTIKKRPLFAKAKRKFKKAYTRAVTDAARDAIRRSGR